MRRLTGAGIIETRGATGSPCGGTQDRRKPSSATRLPFLPHALPRRHRSGGMPMALVILMLVLIPGNRHPSVASGVAVPGVR